MGRSRGVCLCFAQRDPPASSFLHIHLRPIGKPRFMHESASTPSLVLSQIFIIPHIIASSHATCPPQDGQPLPFPPPPGGRACANRLDEPAPQFPIDKHHQRFSQNQLPPQLRVYKKQTRISLARSPSEKIENSNERLTKIRASTWWCAAGAVMSERSRKTVALYSLLRV